MVGICWATMMMTVGGLIGFSDNEDHDQKVDEEDSEDGDYRFQASKPEKRDYVI